VLQALTIDSVCDISVKYTVYCLDGHNGGTTEYCNESVGYMKRRRILLVEDERDIAELVALHLNDLCDEVVVADDGHEGMRLAMTQDWSLIVLDLRLPGPDGLQICRRVRRDRPYQPILMLTSKTSELERVLGLETGADDYLTKPFSVLELVARVRAILRRVDNMRRSASAGHPANAPISAGRGSIDPSRREVMLDGRLVELTAREFDLLEHFARNPGRVFRRADLLDKVWGYGHEGYEHTVNSHINRLRAKIERNPSKPEMIVTVWGVGYKFSSDLPAESHVHAL
jgi:DNA-binding response OmpR family regulator